MLKAKTVIKAIRVNLGLLFACHLLLLNGAMANTDDGADQLAALLASSVFYQANFNQTVYAANGDIVDQSSGSMLLSRPNQLRWNIDAPIEQTIVVNQGQYFQYDRDIDQLIIQPLSEQLAAMPTLLISGDPDSMRNEFVIAELKALTGDASEQDAAQGQASAIRVFTLKPLSEESLFEVLTLEFSGAELQAIAILDDLSQTSRFEFTDIDSRSAIEPSQFILNPPEGTDIIRR